jgi:preprotein translocase subunit SecG
MLYYVMNGLYVFVCLLLLLVVLLQQGKGGDIASAFGGGGSQTASHASTVLGALFMIGALALAIYGQRGPGSVVSGVPGTEPMAPAAATVPAAPAEAGAAEPPMAAPDEGTPVEPAEPPGTAETPPSNEPR